MNLARFNSMQQLYELLDRMLAKTKDITLTSEQCIRICRRYQITGAQLQMYIIQYCFGKDVNLEAYEGMIEVSATQ